MREFYGINSAFLDGISVRRLVVYRPNQIGNVADSGTRGSSQIEHLGSRFHVNVSHTTQNGGS
jgi:hypothetical protein